MKIEAILLFGVPILSVLSLIFVPKNKLFQAQFTFLCVQVPNWILGLSVVEVGLIEYPYREFSTVNRTSFIFEYLVLPTMCVHFNIRFPEQSSKAVKAMYYIVITLAFTITEYFTEKYTDILNYTGWKAYWSFISVGAIFWFSRKATKWFFNGI